MTARPFVPADRQACLAVFDSNVPAFFRPQERGEYEAFLDTLESPYFVLEFDGAVVGCGGFYISEPGLAGLSYGMIRQDLHGKGLGRFLLLYRLRELNRIDGVERVRVHTTQNTQAFFERQGFKLVAMEKNGYASGLDKIEMVMRLSVCGAQATGAKA